MKFMFQNKPTTIFLAYSKAAAVEARRQLEIFYALNVILK